LLNLERIKNHSLESDPYRWTAITDLYALDDAQKLAATYPCDHFKLVSAYGGEREYLYEARSLIGMGAKVVAYPDELSEAWRSLASDLLSAEYREAMSALTGYDLATTPMEANVCHYGPGGSLDAHKDLPEKLVTHVLYFQPFLEYSRRRLSRHLAFRRFIGRSGRDFADRREFICSGTFGQLLARRLSRRQPIRTLAAQHDRDLLPARFREHHVAPRRQNPAAPLLRRGFEVTRTVPPIV
jgi:hypothetical protein